MDRQEEIEERNHEVIDVTNEEFNHRNRTNSIAYYIDTNDETVSIRDASQEIVMPIEQALRMGHDVQAELILKDHS